MDPALDQLVRDVAQVGRDAQAELDFTTQRQRFLRYARHRKLRRRAARWMALGSAAALVLGVALYLIYLPQTLTFQVRGAPGAVGTFLDAPEDARLDVDFSDGSELSLARKSRASVLSLQGSGAKLMVERGSLRAHVVHREGTDWEVGAGPFRVHVVGTGFGLSWDPSLQRFELELYEGSVRVSGPNVRERCVVRSGQRLQVTLSQKTATGTCVVEPSPRKLEPSKPSFVRAPTATPRALDAEAPASASTVATPAPPEWRRLAAAGKHAQAFRALEALDFTSVTRRASAAELMELSDVARFAGQPAAAARALRELRARFPESSEARRAAFLLGRLAQDQQGDPLAGARWFSVYLRKRPDGSFAPEALARLMDCQLRAGRRQAAYQTATRYLTRYPKGAASAQARHLLAEGRAGTGSAAAGPARSGGAKGGAQ